VATAKGVRLETETGERPLPAKFDHDRMLQVLANVISNAIKFTPEGGTVRVRGERVRDEVRFSVADTGRGIPDGMLEAVFERFGQVGANDRRGLDLGLYIARCIVEAHGGRMWAESEPGAWCRVSFTLPA
jgi:signal transduction histidine kinase